MSLQKQASIRRSIRNIAGNYLKSENVETKKKNLDPFLVVKNELAESSKNIASILCTENRYLKKVVGHVLKNEGKKMRPAINLILAKSLGKNNSLKSLNVKPKFGLNYSNIFERQKRVSEVTELLHIASLIHDDVIDDADTRRGTESVKKLFGNRIGALAGRFFLSKASISLANLCNDDVTKVFSEAISDLVKGEMLIVDFNPDVEFSQILDKYLLKNYFKTASLIAHSSKSIALINGSSKELIDASFGFGKNLGISFQIIDDLLDLSFSSSKDTGKPTNLDMKQGILTLPALLSAQKSPEIAKILQRRYKSLEDIKTVNDRMNEDGSIQKAVEFAEKYSMKAINHLEKLPNSEYRSALISLVIFNLKRLS